MSNFIFSSNKGKDTSIRSTYSGTHSGLKTNPNIYPSNYATLGPQSIPTVLVVTQSNVKTTRKRLRDRMPIGY